MKPETIGLLRSPISHETLRLISEIQSGVPRESLVGVDSGQMFVIEAGIPDLLDQQRVVDYNKKYQSFYNLIAPLYDGTLALAARLIRGDVDRFRMEYMQELEPKPGDRFLEVSIGTGANLKYLPANISCYGVAHSSSSRVISASWRSAICRIRSPK